MRWLALFPLISSIAFAQLSAAPTFESVMPPMGTAPVRWPDVAATGAAGFLAVSGAGNVMAQRFDLDGHPVGGAFAVNSDMLLAQAPRVAFAPLIGASLVAWHASISMTQTQLRGRLVRIDGSTVGNDFDISSPGTNWEMGAALAWSSAQQTFLVAWQNSATQIKAQRVSANGQKVGGELTIDSSASYERDPAVGYDAQADQFVVAYAGCVANDDCFARAQRINAADGALVGGPLILEASITAGYVPELAYDAAQKRFLAVWYVPGALHARTLAADGTLGPTRIASAMYAAYDANSVAWSPISGTFVVVTHGTAQDVAVELDATGAPLGAYVLWGPDGVSGNFNPRIAASASRAEFLGVTSTAFGSLSAQRLISTERLSLVDAGVETDGGARPAGDAGSSGSDAGTSPSDGGTPGNISGGTACGCSGVDASVMCVVLLVWCVRRRFDRTAFALDARASE
ncbi:MAG: hypothetical protein QM817_29720 [Archangium sp.]